MIHSIDVLVVVSNMLVVLASLALALVTMKDIVKDDNRTLLAAIRDLIPVNNRKPRKAVPEQEELALVPVDDGKAA
jgi:hypothetical protein